MTHRRIIRVLLAANAVLAAGAVFTLVRPATAQLEASRPRGQYTMVSGKTNQGGPHAVYVLDAASREIVALRWDQSKQTLIGVGYRNLESDGRTTQGR